MGIKALVAPSHIGQRLAVCHPAGEGLQRVIGQRLVITNLMASPLLLQMGNAGQRFERLGRGFQLFDF